MIHRFSKPHSSDISSICYFGIVKTGDIIITDYCMFFVLNSKIVGTDYLCQLLSTNNELVENKIFSSKQQDLLYTFL